MDIVLLCRIACAIYSLSHLWFRYPYRYFRHDGLFMQLIRSQSAAFIDRWYDRYSCSIYSKRLERMEISRSCAPLYSVADPGGKSGPGHLHPVWLYRFRSPIQRKKQTRGICPTEKHIKLAPYIAECLDPRRDVGRGGALVESKPFDLWSCVRNPL